MHNVSPIQAVHAVGAHDALLHRFDLACVTVYLRSLIEANLQFTNEVAPLIELLVDLCDQFAQIFPLHLFALTVEIKPSILGLRLIQLLHHLAHFSADPQLGALLVNQVYEVLSSVLLVGFFQMKFGSMERFMEVRVDRDGG